MLLGSSNNPYKPGRTKEEYHELFILQMMSNHAYAEAYGLLKIKRKKAANDLFNMALCCYHSQLYGICLECLGMILITDLKQSILPERNMTQQKMFGAQTEFPNFDKPISTVYLSEYPDLVSDSILRLKISCFVAMDCWSNIIELSSLLRNSKYPDLLEALNLAETKLK